MSAVLTMGEFRADCAVGVGHSLGCDLEGCVLVPGCLLFSLPLGGHGVSNFSLSAVAFCHDISILGPVNHGLNPLKL